MNRRALLRASAAAGTLLAGCLESGDDPGADGSPDGGGSPTGTSERSPTGTEGEGSGDDGGDGDGDTVTDEPTDEEPTDTETAADDDDTPTGTDEPTETPDGSAGSNALVDRSFEVGGTECGRGANRADVSRGDDRVDVDGTIRGSNGCYTAELERATYDDGTDELRVAVRSYDDSDEREGCMDCLVDVDYRGSFEFEDGTPESVTVVHNGDHVTTS